jgi:Ulp1 family protease
MDWIGDETMSRCLNVNLSQTGFNFYSSLATESVAEYLEKRDEAKVARILKRTPADFLGQRFLFFPLNIERSHWTLFVADQERREIAYYDSIEGTPPPAGITAAVKRILGHDDWRAVHVLDTPIQKNQYDCGIFVLYTIHRISEGREVDFDQDRITKYRKKVKKIAGTDYPN